MLAYPPHKWERSSILGIVDYFTRSGTPGDHRAPVLSGCDGENPLYRDGQRNRKKFASNTSMPAGSSVISSFT
jgi:hypothetical protein